MTTDELEATERAKYIRAWAWPQYRSQADGDPVVQRAFDLMGCQPGETLIDWGCGTGRPAKALQNMGLQVTGFDIAENCLDSDVDIPLVVGTLWAPPAGLSADYAFCTDVLEHIPPEHLSDAMAAIYERTNKAAYIQVDTVVDTSGDMIEPPERYHLSVYPAEWWFEQIISQWSTATMQPATFSRAGFLCRK